MFFKKKEFDPQLLSKTMMGTVTEIFQKTSTENFSQGPTAKTRMIWIAEQDTDKMQVPAPDKFMGRCYISVITLHLSARHLEKKIPCGTVVLYVNQPVALQLLKSLKNFSGHDITEEQVIDYCGEFCNIIVGGFKNDLANLGYADLTISAPSNYINLVPEGAPFEQKQEKYQEVTFYFWNEPALVVDITLAPIPMRR